MSTPPRPSVGSAKLLKSAASAAPNAVRWRAQEALCLFPLSLGKGGEGDRTAQRPISVSSSLLRLARSVAGKPVARRDGCDLSRNHHAARVRVQDGVCKAGVSDLCVIPTDPHPARSAPPCPSGRRPSLRFSRRPIPLTPFPRGKGEQNSRSAREMTSTSGIRSSRQKPDIPFDRPYFLLISARYSEDAAVAWGGAELPRASLLPDPSSMRTA